jgi:hypothetical protein
MNRRTFWVSTLAVALAVPMFALAQDQGRGGRGGFNPEQFRKMMMDRMQEALGATPDEMQVLSPKIEKVMTAQRDAMAGRMGMFGRGGRGGQGRGGQGGGGQGGGFQMPETPVSKAAAELSTTLENKDAPEADIAAKLTALREARAKARAELEAAQKDLQGVLTPRQEAVMVSMGMLD